jgi:hypothetical protein
MLIIGMMVHNVQGVSLLIVHINVFLLNFTQFVRWEGGQHIPTQVQGFPDRSVITGTLKIFSIFSSYLFDEFVFEFIQELKIVVILLLQGLFSYDGLHGSGILGGSIIGIHLFFSLKK